MLNKELCIKCHSGNWNEKIEEFWNERGIVHCYHGYFRSIDHKPPCHCPFVLEHNLEVYKKQEETIDRNKCKSCIFF